MAFSSVKSAAAVALWLTAAPLFAQEPAAADAASATATADTVIATVNGASVTLGDLIAVRGDLPAQYQELPDQALYDGIRQQLADQALLKQAAEAAGLDADPQVARAVAIQRQGLLAEFYMRRAVEQRMTEDALRAAYDARVASAPAIPEVRASHILVADEEKAKDLRAQIDAGADFAGLAAEHGTDGTKTQGGDLGYFVREQMVPEFSDAAFAMAVGEVSQPVQSQFGWHLIKLTDKRDQPKPTFEESRADLEQALGSEIVQQVMTELREGATIDTPEDRPGLDAIRNDALIGR